MNDKVSLKFYYNLGIEYYKLLQQVYGTGQLMQMIDGEPSDNQFEQQSNENENQLVADLQQLNFESNDVDNQASPSKVRASKNAFWEEILQKKNSLFYLKMKILFISAVESTRLQWLRV